MCVCRVYINYNVSESRSHTVCWVHGTTYVHETPRKRMCTQHVQLRH